MTAVALLSLAAFYLALGARPREARANATEQSEEERIASVLQSTLVAHGGEVHRCFEKALADTLDVSGRIELAVDVGDQGKVVRRCPRSTRSSRRCCWPVYRNRAAVDHGRHRFGQHGDRAADLRGPGVAVHHQGR
jgi:hypothetical protein